MKEKILHQPFIFSLAFTTVGFIFYFLCFQSTLETNDDAYMMMFASGFYTGTPMEYILPSGVFLGWMLKCLYLWFPMGNWYVYYLILVHFVSIVAIIFVALLSTHRVALWLVYWLALVFYESYALVYLQFTTSAFLLSIAGYLFLTHLIVSEGKKFLPYLIPLAMLLFASQVREKVPLLVLAVGSPAWAYAAFFQGRFKSVSLFCSIFLVLFFGSIWLEGKYPGKIQDWGKHKALFDAGFYPAYNHPVQVSSGDEAIFRSLEWSKNDFDMFKSGFFELLPKYSMENLLLLSQHFSTLKQDEGDTARIIFYYFGQFKYLFILTLASLLAIFLSKNWYVSLISLSMAFISLGIWFYIGQDLILKARVIVPMLFFIQIYSIYSLSYNYKRFSLVNNPRINRFIPYILCLILIFGVLKIYLNDKNHVRPSISSYSKQYEWLEQHFPDQVKVVWGTSLSVDHISALSNFYVNKKKAQLYLLLANLGYWQNPELLKVHGESDVYMALLNNPKFLLLLADYKVPHLEYLSKFYWENYKMRVRPVLVRSYVQPATGRADFHLYKLVDHGQ